VLSVFKRIDGVFQAERVRLPPPQKPPLPLHA
jgi:hypothetical protein